MFRAVDVAAEVSALIGELALVGERKYLKSAGVGKNRALPAFKFVQTTGFAQNLGARTHIQVICIT